ncbi:MAG TPA: hypothetical protein VE999_05645 [Gemmataceae bacterium]|nr:hypothetical protein [Gemmataceae bacterium]
MNDDFPCSHSMDTCWFALDDVGHIGIFDSGENGHVPNITGEAWELVDGLWRQQHPDGGDSPSPWEHERLASDLGLFYYEYETDAGYTFDPISPYKRRNVPKTPLHVDQLPPTLRQQVKQSRLQEVNFALRELVQPLEQFNCEYSYKEHRVAYLCSDGKTVRPIPGMEDRFAEFCRQFREEYPELAKDMIFEGQRDESQ